MTLFIYKRSLFSFGDQMKIDITDLTIQEINSLEKEIKEVGANTYFAFESNRIILIANNLEEYLLA